MSFRLLTGVLLVTPFSTLTAQTLGQADSILAGGDTASAISAYERILRKNDRDAAAHFKLGMVLFNRHRAGGDVSDDLRWAERHLRKAAGLQRDSAQYSLWAARALRAHGVTLKEILAHQYFKRAAAAGRKHPGRYAAEAEFELARWNWKKYEQIQHRYLFTGDAIAVDFEGLMSEWSYVEDFFNNRVTPAGGSFGEADLRDSEKHLRAALKQDPRYIDAAALLIVTMGEDHRWEEAREITRGLTRLMPRSGRAWALDGLVLTRMGRWRQAQRSFDRALARMTPRRRAPYDNIAGLLKGSDSLDYVEMTPVKQQHLNNLYWTIQQPLFLTNLNEVRTEFFARLAYVNARWSDPWRGYAGYESDRGAVYVRYGPPDIWAVLGRDRVSEAFGPNSMSVTGSTLGPAKHMPEPDNVIIDASAILERYRSTTVWVYKTSRLRFAFSLVPGYSRAVFAGDHRGFYEQNRAVYPARFDNIPIVRNMDTIEVQVAQFRGDSNTTEIGTFSFVPVGRMVGEVANVRLPLTTGVIVKDTGMRDVVRLQNREQVLGHDSDQVEMRSARFALEPASSVLLRVEALIAPLNAAARSTRTLDVTDFRPDTFMLSDLLVARKLEPRDSSYSRWTDFLIVPSTGTFRPEEPVSLLWEMYNLEPDSTGEVHYRVSLDIGVDQIERRTVGAAIIGGIGDALGLSARGDVRTTLEYERKERGRRGGRQVEYVTVELDGPSGYYFVNTTITDLVSGRTQTLSRRIRRTMSDPGVK